MGEATINKNNFMLNIALVTNIPAPYRERTHELVFDHFEGHYNVVYCAEREADREWKFQYGNYKKEILSKLHKNAVHNNYKIFAVLNRIKPDVVIIMGFYPTMIYSYLWTLLRGKQLIIFTDGTLISESHLSIIHRIVRKIIFSKAKAFIGPSIGASELYLSYKVNKDKFFRTYLCVDNESFFRKPLGDKEYDLMFSGQFIERKMPFFFIEAAKGIKVAYGKCKVLILGSGPLKNEILELLKLYEIDYHYPGFIDQKELPKYYSNSKLFLFPTKNDPWGVVVNEAMASGLPVITCEEAGVANDLVKHDLNGYILPLVEEQWVETAVRILNDPAEYNRLSDNAIKLVTPYNSYNAAKGIIDAINS